MDDFEHMTDDEFEALVSRRKVTKQLKQLLPQHADLVRRFTEKFPECHAKLQFEPDYKIDDVQFKFKEFRVAARLYQRPNKNAFTQQQFEIGLSSNEDQWLNSSMARHLIEVIQLSIKACDYANELLATINYGTDV